jgi:DMSO/TMAO reductase YedYZ molybdopterin-dependent catalytic subunit
VTELTRRRLIGALGTGASGLLLAGCDAVSRLPATARLFDATEDFTFGMQRLVSSRDALAPEFGMADLSPVFRANGNRIPASPIWARLMAGRFADWRLKVEGLVAKPLALSRDQLTALPPRTQITRHDCVEGWSAIGRWHGTRLGPILRAAGLRPDARYIVFHCFDDFRGTPYYESIDLIDAFHPQTILAYGLNGRLLPVANGAPLRLRVERQLGYKHAKYIDRIEAVASLADIGRGKGGYWEDVAGYQWYAGI